MIDGWIVENEAFQGDEETVSQREFVGERKRKSTRE